jgi:hypothetical protein
MVFSANIIFLAKKKTTNFRYFAKSILETDEPKNTNLQYLKQKERAF